MDDIEKVCHESLSVNVQEITDTFSSLRLAVAKVATIEDFVALVKPAVNEIFLKHFEFPNSWLYKPEELGLLIQHVMDCINSIMPANIPYRSFSVNGEWRFYPTNSKDQPKIPKPS